MTSLCLNCREAGHVMGKCPEAIQGYDTGWFYSEERKRFKFRRNADGTVCERCKDLNLIELLQMPGSENGFWEFKEGDEELRRTTKSMRNLGQVDTLVFREDCPVCVCLFACSPSPTDIVQELFLFASLTVSRMGGLHGQGSVNQIDTEGKHPYAKHISPLLWPWGADGDSELYLERGDGLCIMEEEEGDPATKSDIPSFRLGGRRLQTTGYSTDLLQSWLDRCERLHPATCQPAWVKELGDILLLDVHTRQITQHPGVQCDYIALSYVWGNVQQTGIPFGTVLPALPRTIEDAIEVTRALGKQYLWVDSICIDQNSMEHKKRQIAMMCSIYQGAYCTLVALSGDSAKSGLPRVNPAIPTYDQFECTLDGLKLVTLMPTLSQMIFSTTWGSRAWTFQEALLSPRCIYFSSHQVHFECNAMTCCEALNETNSHVHNLYWDESFIEREKPESKYGVGVLRNPFVGESRRPQRMEEYGNLLTLYMYREMTSSSDSLNAFSGILQALTMELYPKGFWWGVPIEHFNLGLLWLGRLDMERIEEFPSWSWAGWKGRVWGPAALGLLDGVKEVDKGIQPWIKIERRVDDEIEELIVLFEAEKRDVGDREAGAEEEQDQDPISHGNLVFPSASVIDTSEYKFNIYPGLLRISGIMLRFKPEKYSPPSTGEWEGGNRWTSTTIQDTFFPIRYTYCGWEFESMFGESMMDWLVIARAIVGDGSWVIWDLLCVNFESEDCILARRVAPCRLWVERNQAAGYLNVTSMFYDLRKQYLMKTA